MSALAEIRSAPMRRTFRRESAPMERFITGRDRQSAAAGSDLDAVGERELGVAAADVPDVVLQVMQQVKRGDPHRHLERPSVRGRIPLGS